MKQVYLFLNIPYMGTSHIAITVLGISMLFIYIAVKILDFYGINISQYGSYFFFYLFLLLSYFVLPNKYTTIS